MKLQNYVKDKTLIYMPSDRAVLKPYRLWDQTSLATVQPGIGKIPFAKDIFPGMGKLEFHNCEHWNDGRYLMDTAFALKLYDENNDTIPLVFDMDKHEFTPALLHTEFFFQDGTNRLLQDIAAVDDIFVCRVRLEKPGNYHLLTMTGRPWFDFLTHRLPGLILLEIKSGPYTGTFVAFYCSSATDSSKTTLTGSNFFAAQFKGHIQRESYLVLGIDDNRRRLLDRMDMRLKDPESILEDAQNKWKSYFEEVVPESPRRVPSCDKAVAWASYYIKSNLIEHDKQGKMPGWSVGCGKGAFTGCPVENTQYHILGEQHLKNSSIVLDELCPRHNQDTPWLPAESFNNAHYLFNAYVMKQIYHRYRDREFMKDVMIATEDTLEKVFSTRDKGDGLFWTDTHLDTPMGFDNSSRWDQAYGKSVPFEWRNPLAAGVKAVEGSCFIVDALNTVAYFRKELKDIESAKQHKEKARLIAENIRTRHWSSELGFFVDLVGFNGQKSDILSLAGAAPLWAKVATAEQAEKVAEKIADPKYFKSKYGPTSHAKNHPAYADYWRGDVCLRLNWLVYIGLKNYGFDELAKWILDATLRRFEGHHYDGAEMWDPTTGDGYYTQSAEMGLLMDMIFIEAEHSHAAKLQYQTGTAERDSS